MKTGFFKSLRSKLALVFLLVGLTPLAMVGAIAYREAERSLRSEAGSALAELAQNTSDKLDRNLFERYGDVQAYAQSEAAKTMDPQRIVRWMNTMIVTYSPTYSLMAVADMEGKIIAVNTVDLNKQSIDTHHLLGTDVSQLEWFRAAASGALAENASFVEDFHDDRLVARLQGPGAKSRGMGFSYPIKNDAGKIIGVWTNRFNWKVAEQIVRDLEEAAHKAGKMSTRLMVLNQNNLLLVGHEPSEVLARQIDAPAIRRALSSGIGYVETRDLMRAGSEDMVGVARSRGYSSYSGLSWGVLATRDANSALAAAHALRTTTVIAFMIAGVALAIAALMLASAFTRPINSVADALHKLATEEADLTRRLDIEGQDEISHLAKNFNLFMDRLEAMISQVIRSGIQVTQSTTQIAAGTKELETTVTEQVAATNEVVAAARQITATSQQLARTMSEVSNMSETSAQSAITGHSGLTQMTGTMATMEDASRLVSSKLGAINEKAGNISSVVTTITKVADQTNLLSLNAAIEAEKAGQYGQGFSVVAREIRRLADQTAVATLDIEKMVKDMKSAVAAGVMSMEKFSDQVRQAVAAVSQVSAQLTKIIEQVRIVASRFEAVQEGMASQSEAASQISSSMTQLSETTLHTASALRDTNRSIDALNDAARSLHGMVSRFELSA